MYLGLGVLLRAYKCLGFAHHILRLQAVQSVSHSTCPIEPEGGIRCAGFVSLLFPDSQTGTREHVAESIVGAFAFLPIAIQEVPHGEKGVTNGDLIVWSRGLHTQHRSRGFV